MAAAVTSESETGSEGETESSKADGAHYGNYKQLRCQLATPQS